MPYKKLGYRVMTVSFKDKVAYSRALAAKRLISRYSRELGLNREDEMRKALEYWAERLEKKLEESSS